MHDIVFIDLPLSGRLKLGWGCWSCLWEAPWRDGMTLSGPTLASPPEAHSFMACGEKVCKMYSATMQHILESGMVLLNFNNNRGLFWLLAYHLRDNTIFTYLGSRPKGWRRWSRGIGIFSRCLWRENRDQSTNNKLLYLLNQVARMAHRKKFSTIEDTGDLKACHNSMQKFGCLLCHLTLFIIVLCIWIMGFSI